MIKKVIVTGVLGQDGANMVEYLLRETDHEVYGVMRRTSNPNFFNCKNFINDKRFNLVYADLGDSVSIEEVVDKVQPDYFINFAAQSFVGCSWTIPVQTFDTNATGVLRCLEAIRRHKPDCRFYSAGSSEEFGDVDYSPQDIIHPIKPRSPYGASKASARHLVKVYRESYKLFAVHGILFNHEGTKRGEEFVTRKITKGVAKIASALRRKETFNPLELGNLDAKRDWSDSEDFVDGVWKMVNQESPKDYVLSSGETHSIREFVELSFRYAGVTGIWNGKGQQEQFSISTEDHFKFDAQSSVLMKINPEFYRPAEVEILLGDSKPAKKELNWEPKVSFPELVKKMTKNDIDLLTNPHK